MVLVCDRCGEELEIVGREKNKVFVAEHDCSSYPCDYCGEKFGSEAAMYGHQTSCAERKKEGGK